MRNVVFVAPFFAETTLRFVAAVARLEGVRTTLVSQDSKERLPPDVKALLADHVQVKDAIDAEGIRPALESVRAKAGPIHRLIGTLEELQVPLGQLRDDLGIPGMGAEAGRNFRDKARMKGVLRAHGLPCARHTLATSRAEASAFARDVGYPLIVKPKEGSGSRGTYRLDSEVDLDGCLRSMPASPARPLMLEEFVVGEEHSFDSIAIGGKVVWYSTNDYVPAALEVVREPWIQWCVVLPREVEDPRYDMIRSVAQDALSALGMDTGMSHMEWFRRPDGSVAISEVGARPPGARFVNLISWAHDFDLFAEWARVVVHGTFTPRPRPYAAGAAYLRGQGRGRVARVRGLEQVMADYKAIIVESKVPQVGQPASGSYEGEGYVIVRHSDTAVVRDALARIVSTVRVEMETP